TLVIFYTVIAATYCYFQFTLGDERWLILPWWLLALGALEVALLWETFGISVGMRVSRLRLRSTLKEDEDPDLAQRLARLLSFHVVGFTLIGFVSALWHREQSTLFDLASGTALRKHEDTDSAPRPWYRSSTGLGATILAILTMTAAVFITQINLHRLFTGAARIVPVFRNLLKPDWSILGPGFGLLIVTLFMSLLATFFGVVVAVPLSFLAARNLMSGPIGRLIYTIVRAILSITRSIEPLIWAIIFVFWVRLGPFPGMLALWIHSIADLTKLYSERLESIDEGPVEAIRATGASRLQVIVYGIIPQIVNPYLSFTLYRWDINVRMSTIIGIVAGGGIGQQLYLYIRYWKWSQAATFMILIMATVWIIDYISARLRARLETGAVGKRTGQAIRTREAQRGPHGLEGIVTRIATNLPPIGKRRE
ncbi:phosphonate ABC transporter, permease protein PhnE, partial [Candidatus Bipolaricaulota bacterium]|nr:phosphonate ABC transporter, permease protein PhnE [Candidatus Bipolaricaulota bacterium]